MGTIIVPTKTDTTKTTCIEITSESYKCIDISAFVPQCITITSNVPTSDLYQEQYNREELEITEAPELQIALINNEAPILNVNLDENGVYYVTDFDVVYIDITNWDDNVEYVNIFSNQDGNDAVVFLDEVEERIIWALDDYAFDGTQMWLNAQAKESDKLISPQSSVTVTQMEQTDQPVLSSWVSQDGNTVLNITILDYDATYTYADPIVTGGTATRTDNIIAWTLPVGATAYHEISITATAPLMYESLPGISGGTVNETFYVTNMSNLQLGSINTTTGNPTFWVRNGLGAVIYTIYPSFTWYQYGPYPVDTIYPANVVDFSVMPTEKFYSMEEYLNYILTGTRHRAFVNSTLVSPTFEQLITLPLAIEYWESYSPAYSDLTSYEFYIAFATAVTDGNPSQFPRYGLS